MITIKDKLQTSYTQLGELGAILHGHGAWPVASPLSASSTVALEAAARARFGSFDFLCRPVQKALVRTVHLAGPTQVVHLGEVANSIDTGLFRDAANLLARTSFCQSDICSAEIATLSQGCDSVRSTIDPLSWTYRAKDGPGTTVYSVSDPVLNNAGWHQIVVSINIVLAVSGRVWCSGSSTSTQLNVQLSQLVNMTFFSQDTPPVESEVIATVQRIRAFDDGMLSVIPGGMRWWAYHSTHFVDAEAINGLRRTLDVCHLPVDNVSAVTNVSRSFTAHDSLMLIGAVARPYTRTLLEAGLAYNPSALVVEPGVLCEARCPTNTIKLQALDPRDRPLPHMKGRWSHTLDACLSFLERDYATCNVEKAQADRRFARCMGLDDSFELKRLGAWLIHNLRNVTMNEITSSTKAFQLDCSAFVTAQQSHCRCSNGTESDAKSIRAGADEADSGGNLTSGAMALRARLWSLGYGRSSFSRLPKPDACELDIQEYEVPTQAGPYVRSQALLHSHRVFSCAAAGQTAFEDLCDDHVQPCHVQGSLCRPHSRTERHTCLRHDAPCTDLLFTTSTPRNWLYATDAPRWVRLPDSGDGFHLAPGASLFAYGTSWLREALINAGRFYAMNSSLAVSRPLNVLLASRREGGILPEAADHQTGLQLKFDLPRTHEGNLETAIVQLQVAALEMAGFVDINLKGLGETQICDWKPSLCIGSRAKLDEMIARLQPPPLSEQTLLPYIVHAELSRAPDNLSATLLISG